MTSKEKATVLKMYEKACETLRAIDASSSNPENKTIEKLVAFSIGMKCGLEDVLKELNISI